MTFETNSLQFYSNMCAEIAQQLFPCFGPCGLYKLVNSVCGGLASVHSGEDILKLLTVNHPMGKLIIECALRHQSKTGNNSKGFIILLADIMSKMAAMHEKLYTSEVKLRLLLIRSLRKFRSCVFPNLIVPEIVKKSSYCSSIDPEVIKTVIHSSVSCSYPMHATLFTNVLCEALCLNQVEIKHDVLKLKLNNLISDFHNICINSYHEPPENTRIEKMLIIEQDYLTFYPLLNHSNIIHEARFILLKIQDQHQEDLFMVNEVKQAMAACCFKSNQWKMFCENLSTVGIKLIISNSKITDDLRCWCAVYQISTVQYLSEEGMDKLSKYFGINPLTAIQDIKSDDGFHGTLKSFSRTMINGHLYACLEPPSILQLKSETIEYCDVFPWQIIICGLSSNSCHQTIMALRNALKQLNSWMVPYRFTKNEVSDNTMYIANGPLNKNNKCPIVETPCCAQYSTVDAFVDEYVKGILISSSSDYKFFSQDHSLSTIGVHLPANGTFEITAYGIIKSLLKSPAYFLHRENQTQDDASELDLEVYKIMMEALLQIPFLLVHNSYETQSKMKTMAYLMDRISQLSKDIDENNDEWEDKTSESLEIGIKNVHATNKMDSRFIIVNCKSGKLERWTSKCPIEPLRGKIEMVCNVLNLCEQLLRLETIVSVRSLSDNRFK